MTDETKIINLALKKIDDQMDIIASRNKYYASNYSNFTSGNAKYDSLIRKHQIEYTTKYARNKEVVSKVKHFMANKYNQFDNELFKLLKILISFKGESYNRYAGWVWPHNHKMVINIKDYRVNYDQDNDWIYEVTAHELGHMWSYQLSKISNLNYWELNNIAIKKYLFLKGILPSENTKISWYKMKTLLKEHLSNYSGKSEIEAFAEIFSLSCFKTITKWEMHTHFYNRNIQDILIARQVINEINIYLKQHILAKCFNHQIQKK